MSKRKPTLGVLLGDPTGIGPELVAKLLDQESIRHQSKIVVIGDLRLFEMGQKVAGTRHTLQIVKDIDQAQNETDGLSFLDFPTVSPDEFNYGELNAKAGKSVFDTLSFTLDLVEASKIEGFIFAPFNKEAMRLGGSPYHSELDFFKARLNRPDIPGEINVMDDLWTTRVTSHIAIARVAPLVTKKRVYQAIRFLDDEMKASGRRKPRHAVAALNPHGGEGGLFGNEEKDAILPAIQQAQSEGIDAEGPFPADTLFLRVKDGKYDSVVSMYHDQGQVATKLLGFDRGVTILGGLPVPIGTPAHGTAFDIAGKGEAKFEAITNALLIVSQMASSRSPGISETP